MQGHKSSCPECGLCPALAPRTATPAQLAASTPWCVQGREENRLLSETHEGRLNLIS